MHYLLNHLDDGLGADRGPSAAVVGPGAGRAGDRGAAGRAGPARADSLRRLTTATASVVFTIPSLALFVVLPLIIGTRILDEANVMVALTVYTTALLVRAVLEALDAVPAQVRDAATAVGYPPITRMLKVELPLSIPVLVAGSARGGGDQHLDGLGGCGDRHRRPGHLVHRGLPDQQERPDRCRDHRHLRACGRHRRR